MFGLLGILMNYQSQKQLKMYSNPKHLYLVESPTESKKEYIQSHMPLCRHNDFNVYMAFLMLYQHLLIFM